MSTDNNDNPLSNEADVVIPLEVLQRWDDSSEVRYSLIETEPQSTLEGEDYAASAVDKGGLIRDVRVVVPFGDDLTGLKDRVVKHMTVLALLRNSNIGVAEAVVAVNGGWGVVLPAASGRTLSNLIDGGPLPPRATAEIGLEIAWGLAATHAAVIPDKIRPIALPHGNITAEHVTVSGLGEVVLVDYNLHHAQSMASSTADDVQALARLMVHAMDGAEPPVLPAEADLARAAIEEDLKGLAGLSDEFRDLLREMLDPDPEQRADIRSVAGRLRRIIPEQDGLWLSSWAETTIGRPERERPAFAMPTPTLVAEDVPAASSSSSSSPNKKFEEDDDKHRAINENPLYVKKGRGRGKVQLRMPPALMAVIAVVFVAFVAGTFQLARGWLDFDGPFDMADVATDKPAPSAAAMAGPVAPGKKGKSDEAASEVPLGDVTVLDEDVDLKAAEEDAVEEPEREKAESDEAIDPQEPAEDELSEDAAEDELSEDELSEDELSEDELSEDAPSEDAVAEDALSEDALSEDAVAEDALSEDAVAEDAPSEDAVAEDAPSEDAAAEDAAAEDDGVADAEDEADYADPVPAGPPPWPRPSGTLGDFDLFVEVPLAQEVVLKCTNGLRMAGPSAFRAAIMKSTKTRCVAQARMRGGVLAQAPIELNQPLDLICRHGFHSDLRCVQRPTGKDLVPVLPDAVDLDPSLFEVRVRAPLAVSMRVSCVGSSDARDVERIALSQVSEGPCSVTADMPDGAYAGSFKVDGNGEFTCVRDYAGPLDEDERRPLRCAPVTMQ